MIAEIICVGSELLLGDIVNTNAQFLSKSLAHLGIEVHYQTVVGDNRQRLQSALEIAFSRSDIVVTTGGLGPTKDDLTKESVSSYFKHPLVFDQDAYDNIKSKLPSYHKEQKLSQSNTKQAYVPKGCIVLHNHHGTAPGCILKSNEKLAILLPGPPKEMETMFRLCSERYLSNLTDYTFVSINVKLKEIGESAAADKVSDLLDSKNPTVAPYAKEEGVLLRVTASAHSKEEALSLMEPIIDELKNRFGEQIKQICLPE